MKYLWSPWRMKYVSNQQQSIDCVFCEAQKQRDCVENLILHRASNTFIILNRFPYSNGHLMIVPYQHCPSYEDLDAEVRAEIMEMINDATRMLREAYHPPAFNVGANIGTAAGAGIAAHVHFHIVPRWAGDTNFMTSLSDTRVIPESLEDTYQRLKAAWNKISH